MIGIINIILILIFMITVPFALGLLLEPCFADKNRGISEDGKNATIVFSRCFVSGLAILLASFQFVAVPLIRNGYSYSLLLYAYTALVGVLLIASIVLNIRSISVIISDSYKKIADRIKTMDRFYLLIGIGALLVIAFQTGLLLFKMHTDTDDCRFLAEALEAIERNTLLRVHPITGEALDAPVGEMLKDVSSPYPLFIAVLSSLTRLHPTVMAHVVIPALLVPLCYMMAYLIGVHLFDDINKRFVFMFILSVIVLFSFESIYTWGYTLLTIIWQGRSISAVIMLPFLWYVFMQIYSVEKTADINKGLYIAALITALANADLSGMGTIMAPLVGGAFAASDLIRNRRIIPAVIMVITVIPAGLFALMYTGSW